MDEFWSHFHSLKAKKFTESVSNSEMAINSDF